MMKMRMFLLIALLGALTTSAFSQVSPQRYQTPVPPFPYGKEDLEFRGASGEIDLSGTLTIPEGKGPFAVAILVSGAGGQDRDGTIMGHRPFLVIADYLTRRGIAVFRYDDRGIGKSTGERVGATTEDFAMDMLGAARKLASHKLVDPSKIGIIGHSEGGTIASIAASRCTDISFIVMLGSPGLPGREYNLQYEASVARAMGQSEEAIKERSAFQSIILDIVLSDEDDEMKESKIRKLYLDKYPGLPKERIDRAVARFLSPWFGYNLSYDPRSTISALRCAVLAVYGGKDVQVPAEGNADAVNAALKAVGVSRYAVKTLPDLNHFFQTAPTGSPAEYGVIDETISPVVLELLVDWIEACDR